MKITELTAVTLGKKIKAKEITVAEAVSAVLEQIEAVEGGVHAYVTLEEKEKEMIVKALEKNHGKRKLAAQDLGISERTLYRKLKEYDIEI